MWTETFETDEQAFEEFARALKDNGLIAFTSAEPTATRH